MQGRARGEKARQLKLKNKNCQVRLIKKEYMSLNINKLLLRSGKLLIMSCLLFGKIGKHLKLTIGSWICMFVRALNLIFLESNGISLIDLLNY